MHEKLENRHLIKNSQTAKLDLISHTPARFHMLLLPLLLYYHAKKTSCQYPRCTISSRATRYRGSWLRNPRYAPQTAPGCTVSRTQRWNGDLIRSSEHCWYFRILRREARGKMRKTQQSTELPSRKTDELPHHVACCFLHCVALNELGITITIFRPNVLHFCVLF